MVPRRKLPEVAIIQAGSNFGAEREGALTPATGPREFVRNGLVRWLQSSGLRVSDMTSIDVRPYHGRDDAPHFSAERRVPFVAQFAWRVSEDIAHVVEQQGRQGRISVILGGDHSISIGTSAGLEALGKRIVKIVIDDHLDFNDFDTSSTTHIHGMSLNAETSSGNTGALATVRNPRRKIDPRNILVLGPSDMDSADSRRELKTVDGVTQWHKVSELDAARNAGITVVPMADIRSPGFTMDRIFEAIDRIRSQGDIVIVSVDLDGIRGEDAPGTPMRNANAGFTAQEVREILEYIGKNQKGLAPVGAIEIAEHAPGLDRDGKTAALGIDLIVRALTGKASIEPKEVLPDIPVHCALTPRQAEGKSMDQICLALQKAGYREVSYQREAVQWDNSLYAQTTDQKILQVTDAGQGKYWMNVRVDDSRKPLSYDDEYLGFVYTSGVGKQGAAFKRFCKKNSVKASPYLPWIEAGTVGGCLLTYLSDHERALLGSISDYVFAMPLTRETLEELQRDCEDMRVGVDDPTRSWDMQRKKLLGYEIIAATVEEHFATREE